MGFWPDITTRSTRVQWHKVGGQRIAPGHRWTFTYDVIPVLYLGFENYAMGQEDVSFIYEDDTGRGSSYTAHRLAGSATLSDLVNEAFADVGPGEPIVAALPYKATLPRGQVTSRASILYEGVATDVVIWPPANAGTDGDLDGDGRVGLADFAILAAAWLDYIEQADIAPPGGDCRVDQSDLLVLAQQWMSM